VGGAAVSLDFVAEVKWKTKGAAERHQNSNSKFPLTSSYRLAPLLTLEINAKHKLKPHR
jgi:hypothetical protein